MRRGIHLEMKGNERHSRGNERIGKSLDMQGGPLLGELQPNHYIESEWIGPKKKADLNTFLFSILKGNQTPKSDQKEV